MKVLFHLISGQNMPVYIADKTINPDKNVYVYTEAAHKNLDQIKSVLSRESDDLYVTPYDYNENIKILQNYIFANLKGSNQLILNFTGGTKISSLASFELFRNLGNDAVYINSENDEIIYFKGEEFPKIEKINVSISPKAYLKLHGHSIKSDNFNELNERSDRYDRRFFI